MAVLPRLRFAMPLRSARRDPRLRAVVLARSPLVYAAGADPALDRPPHVRAASALVRAGDGWLIVQDSAHFVAVVSGDGAVGSVLLPPGSGGRRQFEDIYGNKAEKMDLEAAFLAPLGGQERLVALGSGSTPARERVVTAPWRGGAIGAPTVTELPALYAALRARVPGADLNLEGAWLAPGGTLRLLQRGNGAGDLDAVLELPAAWLAALLAGEGGDAPEIGVEPWDLGEIAGTRLTFTDGCAWGATRWLFSAAAEDSPDAVRDGEVAGSVLGWADAEGGAWAPIGGGDGEGTRDKIEGIALGQREGEVWVVTDADDPEKPAELLRIGLEGPWPSP